MEKDFGIGNLKNSCKMLNRLGYNSLCNLFKIKNMSKLNPTFKKTICKSQIWQEWIKYQEKKMEWDVGESTECGWLSDEHWEAFISWVKIHYKIKL